jgi:hypothetical protein
MRETTTSRSHRNNGADADCQPESGDAIGAGEVEISRWEPDDDDDSSVIRGID